MEQDALFQALDSPYRRGILRLLQGGELSAGEIASRFDVSQPSISRHLDVLKRARLISARRDANQIIYSLNPPAMAQAADCLAGLLGAGGAAR